MPMVLGENKALSNITVFTANFSCIQYFMIMESIFHSDCYSDFLGKTVFLTRKYIEIRKRFIAYRSPTCAYKSFCLYMCSHILHNI